MRRIMLSVRGRDSDNMIGLNGIIDQIVSDMKDTYSFILTEKLQK